MCAVCPKCKKKIEYLNQRTTGVEKCEVFFNEKENYIDWRDEEFDSDGIVLLFNCPECDNELDFGEEEAHKFLKEKDELQELVAEKINKDKKNERKRIY